jgi:glycosyltransferase involved in cell wall biosynthesis
MRLVSIHPCPAPYTTAVLNALARRIDLHVIYFSDQDRVSGFVDSWGVPPEFDYSVVWSRHLDLPSIRIHAEVSVGIARKLSALKPDAILVVSWKPTAIEPLLWSRWTGSAAVMWSESTPFSGLLRGSVASVIRRSMLHACDAYVTNGSQATRYLEELGVSPARIVTSTLPAARIPATTARVNPTATRQIRFLFVGRLIPPKRPLEVIEAFRAVRAEVPEATLTVIGRGGLETEVRHAVQSVPGVRYVGRVEGDELAGFYAESDVLVFPAQREVWGVVVNEALSHGLFVVASDQVGSAYDLLDDETGVMLPANDLQRLAPCLIEIARTLDVSDDARRSRASAIATCTPERFADDIKRSTVLALDVRPRRGPRSSKRSRAA